MWVLVILYAILWMAKHKVFMFQRTIRKISLKYGIPQNNLDFLYPQKYKTLHWVSAIRWVILVVVFFLNWKLALGLLVSGAVITMACPEQDDYVNMKIMLDDLQLNDKGINEEVLNATRSMIGEILSGLDPEKGWAMIGRIVHIKCDCDFVRGEVVNIKQPLKQYNIDADSYVVIFEEKVSIKGSRLKKEHLLSDKNIDNMMCWKLTGSKEHTS